jgi:hypothetical protein
MGAPHTNGQSRPSGLLQRIQHGPADTRLSGEMVGSCSSAGGCVDVCRTCRLADASAHGPDPQVAGGVFEVGKFDDPDHVATRCGDLNAKGVSREFGDALAQDAVLLDCEPASLLKCGAN